MTSIRSKLIVMIAVPTLLVYVAILGGALASLRARSYAELEQGMTRLAANYAGRFDGCLREAAAVAGTTATALGLTQMPEPDLFAQLRKNVGHQPFIFGACAAFEPGTVRSAGELYAPYAYRQGESIREMNITREVYDWYADPQWTWFQKPKALQRGVWSPPYFDEGAGNVLMTTYSAPFYSGTEFRGVTTVDIDLTRLRETIGEHITGNNEFFILAGDGHFVYSPQSDWILNRTIADVARQSSNAALDEVIPRLLNGRPGVATVPGWASAEKQLLFFAPIPSTDWTFVAYTPEGVAFAGVHSRMAIAAAALAATLALIIGAIVHVSRRITKPLANLTQGVHRIEQGDLDARVTGVNSRDELGVLATAFNSMAGRLREHVDRLAAEEASRRKLERDLEIAREIQRGLLPARHPQLPGYDVAGWTKSADQTGGDYYDWQTLEDGTIVISLADVTGHGIGPALVTAACRAYARASFSRDGGLTGAMDRINGLLCEDLQDGRFVTYVAAIIDPPTHQIQMLSAGHGPLLLYREATRVVEQFVAHQIPFGLMADVAHGPPSSFVLSPGDFLMFITDGFFEWANADGEQYGLERLTNTIRAARGLSSAAIIESIVKDVLTFANGSTQLDDLTAVIVQRTQ